MRRLAFVAATMLAVGCNSTAPPSPAATAPLAVARDASFELTVGLAVPVAGFKSGDPIPIDAAYQFLGPEPSLVAGSAYPSGVYFSLEQLDGPLDQAGGVNDLMCLSTPLTQGVLVHVPFYKSGAYSASDPNAAFWDRYFADPMLRLPAGQWRITAHLDASLGLAGVPCAGEAHTLAASVTFHVGS